jgi:transcriptional regulator GlxA family with amidase domain
VQDPRIAAAVRLIRQHPQRAWTVEELAAVAALSRSTFAARFAQGKGRFSVETFELAPMPT